MTETTTKAPKLEKIVKENPLAALFGLFTIASAIDQSAKATPAPIGDTPTPAAVPVAVEPEEPTPRTPMERYAELDAKATADVAALIRECFADGSSVFIRDLPGKGCWDYDIDGKYKDTPHTVAILRNTLDQQRTGVSVLNAPDAFSESVGQAIALRRAMDKPVPKDYYMAGSLLALASIKPGAFIRVTGKTVPLTKSSNAEIGKVYRVRSILDNRLDLEIPFRPWVHINDVELAKEPEDVCPYKIGDVVKVIRKSRAPSTSASDVNVGGTYTVTDIRYSEDIGHRVELDRLSSGWVHVDDVERAPLPSFKVGEGVKVVSKIKVPSDSSAAETGKVYTVKEVRGNHLRLDIDRCPWVNKSDVVSIAPFVVGDKVRRKGTPGTYTVEGFQLCSCGRPAAKLAGLVYAPHIEGLEKVEDEKPSEPLKVGDKVRIRVTGEIRTVKELVPCKICGEPSATFEEKPGTLHVKDCVKVVEKWVKREANPGDTIRRKPGMIFGKDPLPYKVKAIDKCHCGARILILEDSDDRPHPGNYEVLEYV